jgi:hypothetical protein
MMKRPTMIAVLGITALILLKVALNTLVNPMDRVRDDVAAALADIPANAPLDSDEGQDYARWEKDIRAVPTLWQEIIAPPPPAPPKPPPKPSAPDLAKMLANISIGKGQIGKTKIRVLTPDAPRGRWMKTGDVINGCTLESFTRKEAIFTYYWEDGGKILEVALLRE